MKNFNWGHGITLFFVVFIGFLVTALIQSAKMDHSLVADDYYAQDIAFQQHYDKISNYVQDKKSLDVTWMETEKKLMVSINGELPKQGKMILYKASNKGQDQAIDFSVKGGENIVFNGSELRSGKWKIKVDWKEGTTPYYYEEDLYIAVL